MPAAKPAFTSVTARRTLAKPGPPPAAQPQPAKKIDWPPSVREYVQRAFVEENRIPGIESSDMQIKLKEIITDAAENGRLHDINWEIMLLPQQLIQSERAKAAVAPPLPPPWAVASPSKPILNHASNGVSPDKSLKRKSLDLPVTDGNQDNIPPWERANKKNVFEDRITYASKGQADRMEKRQKKMQGDSIREPSSKFSQGDLDKRKRRFDNGKQSAYGYSSRDDSPMPDPDEGPVVGTCQDLEKNYFRLTSAPKPETVRPLPVLKKTLDLLKQKWRLENNYGYICDQFKSLRQDLTVQHIKNEFTVNVYELHARIALEKGDLGEYNQCQTQLRALYSQKLGGHPSEFLAYRILYFIYTCNRTDMNEVLADLTPADKETKAVKHALNVRSALALGNYHRFFRLYLETPHMGAYLMDMFVVRERLATLSNICKAYKPSVTLRFLTDELGFDSDQDCVEFLIAHGAEAYLETSAETEEVRLLTGKSHSVFEQLKTAAFRRVDIKGQI